MSRNGKISEELIITKPNKVKSIKNIPVDHTKPTCEMDKLRMEPDSPTKWVTQMDKSMELVIPCLSGSMIAD